MVGLPAASERAQGMPVESEPRPIEELAPLSIKLARLNTAEPGGETPASVDQPQPVDPSGIPGSSVAEGTPPTSDEVSPHPETEALAGNESQDEPAEELDNFSYVTSRVIQSLASFLLSGRWVGGEPDLPLVLPVQGKKQRLFSYVLLGPLVRTSAPALIYPAIYPHQVGFSGLDIGLDILGFGRMPDDNWFLHRRLWPNIDGGSIMVPFQFGIYSQMGLGGALLASLLIGWLISKVWMLVINARVALEIWAPSAA